MYSYYHEHFELANLGSMVRITCVCGNDFLWSVEEDGKQHLHNCPFCNEAWFIGWVGQRVILSRKKTGAKISLLVDKEALVPRPVTL